MLKIGVIVASVRDARQGDRVARWIFEAGEWKPGLLLERLDLRDWPIPDYRQAATAKMAEHT